MSRLAATRCRSAAETVRGTGWIGDGGRVCAANGGSGPGELDLSWWKLVVQAAGIFFRSCFFFLRSLEEFMLS